jgi:hypothetical protein
MQSNAGATNYHFDVIKFKLSAGVRAFCQNYCWLSMLNNMAFGNC